MRRKCKILSGLKSIFKRFNLIALLLIISIIFSACSTAAISKKNDDPQLVAPSKLEYKTSKVRKGTIRSELSGMGQFVSAFQQDLSFKTGSGYLKSLNFKQGDIVRKGDILAEIDCTDLENQLKEEEVKLKIAQLDYESSKSKGATSYDAKMAALNIEMEKVEIKKLKDKLSQSHLVSGMNGIVTYVYNMRIGDPVTPYTTMFVISDTQNLLIEYSGEFAGNLKVGTLATIEYKGKLYDGKVVSEPQEKEEKNAIGTTSASIFISVDKFNSKDSAIGDSVKLSIEIMKKDNVLTIPFSALHSFNQSAYVYVMENGVKTEKPVQFGIVNTMEVEIIKGLKEGEEVIID